MLPPVRDLSGVFPWSQHTPTHLISQQIETREIKQLTQSHTGNE